ncbi:phytanoyl-CoA dioxygenase family protein [Nocardia amamiensis]|uniref:phytanoyl-CoA dioxygenase family protein n=1 Tax=Nocardia amamiensis TaxID=404578 RepID=UPI00082A41B5|nr:phytanoyl-CoA dioxygenase family protein [Nocardia amamiensis]
MKNGLGWERDDYPRITDGLRELHDAIAELGMDKHIVELETAGYTVVPDVLTPPDIGALTDDLVTLAEADDDRRVDLLDGSSHRHRTQEVPLLFLRGGTRLRDAARHPRTLLLVRYLLGNSCVLSSFTGYVKGPGRCELGVHSDTGYVPDPLPPYAQIANVNLLLTDYTAENGCLTMVPGSHRYCHRPREGQGVREVVPVVAPAGSAVVFHGNTWHAAMPRTAPGVRLTLSILYSRLYMRVQEDYARAFGADRLAALPSELRVLVAPDIPTGWRSVDEARVVMARRRENSRLYYRTRGQHV